METQLTRRKLLELIENDYPLANYDRLDGPSREIIDSLVEDGLLEMTEDVVPEELQYLFIESGDSIVIHDYRVTPHGLMYINGAITDKPGVN